MLDSPIAQAIVLGVVEGLTEFLPVSSTGHLILSGWLLGFDGPPGKVFEVAIQLGAIVAVCVLYFRRLWRVAVALPASPAARRFLLTLLLGFSPAMVLGALLHGFIKGVLFSPWVVVFSLVLGGCAILIIERMRPQPKIARAEDVPPATALGVGFCQALAMIPGVSRSGATILGGVLLGLERRAAAEFSFFLAIPTMLAATVYDLYKNRMLLSVEDFGIIAIGFLSAMVTAMLVVEGLLRWLQRHTFEIFGWYRIAIGLVMAIVLLRAG
ncbi:MAG: undecaprenyl-diphosphate phosphatase [Geminicoccaceae bacterium]|nr:undecaprenyl-diphosphate phosphatase [Geminicoccaceae bacterium]MDW8342391.1 undecaprenyl-diphosphate phosphatase [Geminicoccaceae bacterium]